MPYPRKGESKEEYVSRFMKSGEAQSDFPDEKQRIAVAYSMYEKRNATDMYGREHPWPKKFQCKFIEPGVVRYQDLGPCKVCGQDASCPNGACEPEGELVLVRQDALTKMAASFVGKPVLDVEHRDVTPDTIAKGEADGIVTRVWMDDKSGWWMCEFLVWSPDAQRHCMSDDFFVSCAYEPTEVNSDGGVYHSIDYQEEVLNGQYTHLAVVRNPRYEGAVIQLTNSKGANMSWKFWKKGDRKNAAPLDPKATHIDVDGEKVSLQNLFDAAREEEAAKEPLFNDDTVLEVDGKERKLGELKDSYRANKSRKNEDAKCPSCDGSGKKKAEAENAAPKHEDAPGEQHPLPDLRDPKQNDQAEDAAKKAEAEAQAKKPLELQQADAKMDAHKPEAPEKKNDQAEEAAKKAEAEAQAKKVLELQQADEAKKAEDEAKAKAEAEKREEKRNAGKRSFADLRNAAHERTGEPVKPIVVMRDERLARGSEKYGSGK